MLDGGMAFWPTNHRRLPRTREINVVADGISQKLGRLTKAGSDGSEWTVCEDWGLINDILHVMPEDDIHAFEDIRISYGRALQRSTLSLQLHV